MQQTGLKGATVYVVGGSLGIGLASAKQAARLGSNVAIFARRLEPLRTAVEEIRRCATGAAQQIASYSLDVAQPHSVLTAIDTAVAEVGVPTVLINCAGRANPRRFEDITFEQFDETLRVNVHGCWNVLQAVVPHMRKGGGHIVNTSSLAGLIGLFGYTDYCASKFAIIGLSEALRQELWRDRISVSVLCPPDTDTPGFAQENETKPKETRALSAAAKVLGADHVATELFRGIKKGQFLIIPGWEGKMGAWIKRIAPWLVDASFRRALRKAQAQ